MEDVQLLQGHQIQGQEYRLLALEMAAFVEHEAAPGKARPVGDLQAGDAPVQTRDGLALFHFDRQQLAQRLQAIKDPGRFRRLQRDRLRRDRQPVAFLPERLQPRLQPQAEGVLPGLLQAAHRQLQPGWSSQQVVEIVGIPAVGQVGQDGRSGG